MDFRKGKLFHPSCLTFLPDFPLTNGYAPPKRNTLLRRFGRIQGGPMFIRASLIVFLLAPLVSPSFSQSTSAQLGTDIRELELQIKEAELENGKYSGGLVKALIEARIQILKQTDAMLSQKLKAQANTVNLTYTIEGKPFVVTQELKATVPNIEGELKKLDSQIAQQKIEAAKYSGGLVLAMTLSTIAQLEQTKAMLDQRRLSILYSLPQYISPTQAPIPAGTKTTPAAADSAAAQQQLQIQIVDIDAKITESNSTWSRFAWKLTVKNLSAVPHELEATIEFQDTDGFIVDSDREYSLLIAPNEEHVFTGTKLLKAASVGKVAKTYAKVGIRR